MFDFTATKASGNVEDGTDADIADDADIEIDETDDGDTLELGGK